MHLCDLPGPQLGSLEGGHVPATTGYPSANDLGQHHPGQIGRVEDIDIAMGGTDEAAAREGDNLTAARKLFDSQQNMFAMEYMKQGDVCPSHLGRGVLCRIRVACFRDHR